MYLLQPSKLYCKVQHHKTTANTLLECACIHCVTQSPPSPPHFRSFKFFAQCAAESHSLLAFATVLRDVSLRVPSLAYHNSLLSEQLPVVLPCTCSSDAECLSKQPEHARTSLSPPSLPPFSFHSLFEVKKYQLRSQAALASSTAR